MVFAALLVFLVLVALAWWAVMRLLKDDGFPVRASLDKGGSVSPVGLGPAKDRNAGQTWDPEL
jgi:hypothetical protein